MNPSKSAAVLMLVGAFAAGVATTYAGTSVLTSIRARQPDCPPARSSNDRDWRQRFAQDLGLDSAQSATLNVLLDERRSAVMEVSAVPRAQSDSIFAAAKAKADSIMAVPRAKIDSINAASREKQYALYTPEQRAKLEERKAAAIAQQTERQAQRARCEKMQPNQQTTKNKPNN
jgi:Spy/CpxP family protein refolding chaperone